MKVRNPPQGTLGMMVLIAVFTAVVAFSITPAGFAQDEYGSGLRVRQSKSDKKSSRRSVRKHTQKNFEGAKRKDSSRDIRRLDHRIDTATVKIVDAKIVDRKYRVSEMKREREDAKLAEDRVLRPERPSDGRRARAKVFHLEKEKRDPILGVGF